MRRTKVAQIYEKTPNLRALLSAQTIAAELEDKRLTILPIEGMPMMRQWFVVKMLERRLLPAAHARWDHLTTESTKFLPQPPPSPATAPSPSPTTRARRAARWMSRRRRRRGRKRAPIECAGC
jgi:hypothetical protein